MPVEADAERGKPTHHQECSERCERPAGVDLDPAHARDEVATAGDGPGKDVGVAADVLRRRFDDEVGAELSGPAHVRRGERVVDDVDRAVTMREVRECRVVGDHHRRVRQRLRVEHASGARAERAGDRIMVGGVDEVGPDAERPEHVDEQRAGRSVDRVRGDDAVAGPHQ